MVESISVAELRERLAAVQVVDVRREPAFRRGHLPGATNVPLPALPDRVGDVEFEDEVVCVCPKGESSLRAARLLEAYEGVADDAVVYNLDAGLQAWDGPTASGPADGDAGTRNEGGDGSTGAGLEAPF